MKRCIAIHTHEYGTSVLPFTCDSKIPTELDVVDALGIDFEPEKQECIDIHSFEDGYWPHIQS